MPATPHPGSLHTPTSTGRSKVTSHLSYQRQQLHTDILKCSKRSSLYVLRSTWYLSRRRFGILFTETALESCTMKAPIGLEYFGTRGVPVPAAFGICQHIRVRAANGTVAGKTEEGKRLCRSSCFPSLVHLHVPVAARNGGSCRIQSPR
jgi:hypothetical protein